MAILWVVFYHVSGQIFFSSCFGQVPTIHLMRPISIAGDLGVDIFFVLSGFLIAFILLKEHKKYGEIDVIKFYKSRFLRIWPALIACNLAMTYLFATQWQNYSWLWLTFSVPVFANNFVGPHTHLWSVAVEFQFYLISPFIVRNMAKRKNTWVVPIIFAFVSVMISLDTAITSCDDLLVIGTGFSEECLLSLWHHWYQNMICRCVPYLAGMLAAQNHLNGSFKDSPCLEWLSFGMVTMISYLGVNFDCVYIPFFDFCLGPFAHLFYLCMVRGVFGICLAYLIARIVSVPPDHSLGCRPTALMRKIYSSNIWLPIANLSYSMYLFHPVIINRFQTYAIF